MTKRRKKLLVAIVILTGGLLVLAGVSWWRAGRAPVLRFLGGWQAVYHAEAREGRIDVYSWPAEFEGMAAQAGKELLRAGFEDIAGLADPNCCVYARPGPHQIVVRVYRGRFEKQTGISTECSDTPGWVTVNVEQTYFGPLEYLGRLLERARSPPPSFPPPKTATGQ